MLLYYINIMAYIQFLWVVEFGDLLMPIAEINLQTQKPPTTLR